MSDIHSNEGGPVEGGAPLPKPDLPITAKQETPRITLRERVANSKPVRGDEAGIRSVTRKRPDDPGPAKVDLSDVARHDGSLSLREASAAYKKLHREQHGRDVNSKYLGYKNLSPENAVALSEGMDDRPSEQPRTKVALVDDDGKVVKPIGDRPPKQAIREDGETFGGTESELRRSAEYLQNYRKQLAEYEQAVIKENFANTRAEENAQTLTPEAVGEINRLTQEHNQQLEQQQPAQQPDALAAERQRLVAEYQRAAAYRQHAQLTSEERQDHEALHKLDRWAQGHPEFHDANLFQNLVARAQKGDIQAAKKLQWFNQARGQQKAIVDRLTAKNQARVNLQIALEQDRAQQNWRAAEAQRAQENTKYDAWLEQTHPNHVKGEGKRELRDTAKEILREHGLTDEQIKQLRLSATEQAVLTDAAILRIGRARAKEITKANLPPVQRPGTVTVGRASVGDHASTIKRLQGELSSAKGHKAVTIAAEIQKLKRAMATD
jgi:hypothetical protein